MTDPTAYLRYRVRILPNQLAAARTRVVHLEREAIRYGFIDLLADAPLAGRYDPASIVDSEAVLNSYAAPEWRELDENGQDWRSEEHTSELQSLMRISYAVFCLKKKN